MRGHQPPASESRKKARAAAAAGDADAARTWYEALLQVAGMFERAALNEAKAYLKG